MRLLRLSLFALRNYAAYAQWHAGAEMFGGAERVARRAAHRDLTVAAIEAMKLRARGTRP